MLLTYLNKYIETVSKYAIVGRLSQLQSQVGLRKLKIFTINAQPVIFAYLCFLFEFYVEGRYIS